MRHLGRIRTGFALAIVAFSATALLCAPASAADHDIRFEDVLEGNVPGVTVSNLRGNGNYGQSNSLVGSFTNETGETLRMYVPPGMYFSPSDSSEQPLITGGCVVQIPPTRSGQTTDVGMTAYCGDSGAHVPSSGTGFTYEGFVPDDQRRLLENAEREGTQLGAVQGYVWQMTNGTGEPLDEAMRRLLEGGQVQPGQVAAAGAAAAGAAAGGQLLMNRMNGGSDTGTPPPAESGIPSGDLDADGGSGGEGTKPPEEGEGEPEKPPPEEGEKAEGEDDKKPEGEDTDDKADGKDKEKDKSPGWQIHRDPNTGQETWTHGDDVYMRGPGGNWVRQADASAPGGDVRTIGATTVGHQDGLYSASATQRRGERNRETDVAYDRKDHAGGVNVQQGQNVTSVGHDDGRTDLNITRNRGEGQRTTSATHDNRDGSSSLAAQQGDNVLNASRAADGSLGLSTTRDRGEVDRQTDLRYNPDTHDASVSAQQGDNKTNLTHEGDKYRLELNRDRDVHDRQTTGEYDLGDHTGMFRAAQGDNVTSASRDADGTVNLNIERDRGEGSRNTDMSWNPDKQTGGLTAREGENLTSLTRQADGTYNVNIARDRGGQILQRNIGYNPETNDGSIQFGQGRNTVDVSQTGDRTQLDISRARGETGTRTMSTAYDSGTNAGSLSTAQGANKFNLSFSPEEYNLSVNRARPEGQAPFSQQLTYRPGDQSGTLKLNNIELGREGDQTYLQVGQRGVIYNDAEHSGTFAWATPRDDGYTWVKGGQNERWGTGGSRPLGPGNIEWQYEQFHPETGGGTTRQWQLEWNIGEGDEQFGIGVGRDADGSPMPTLRGTVKF